jgi:hypothetical protein
MSITYLMLGAGPVNASMVFYLSLGMTDGSGLAYNFPLIPFDFMMGSGLTFDILFQL